ncbi:MAG: xylulokinase [Ignavibacteriae bacterium]|nr:xylulokinase [Ignavibacteriota bacterium]
MRPLTLGIDIGTGGAKAVLVRDDGAVMAKAFTPYPLSTPRPLWTEQDPRDWWEATLTSISRAMQDAGAAAADVIGIGITGQMHGLVALDEHGEPLRPCILWNDQRTVAECDEIHTRIGADRVLRICGKPALPSFTAPKLLWMQAHEPALFMRIHTVLLPKDYIRWRLSGALLSDVSDASGTLLFDTARRTWSEDVLAALDIPRRVLPEVTESTEASAFVSADAARVCGLRAGTPIAGGAGDQAAEAVGCGVLGGDEVSVTIGTSGVVFAGMDDYRLDPAGRVHSYCHAIPGHWHVMGVMLSAGGSFRWHRDTFCAEEREKAAAAGIDAYDLMTEFASRIGAGSDGLLFLPYLTGERTPHADPYARGVFFGMTLRHTRHHFTRAVMEGIGFGLKDAFLCINDLGYTPDTVRLSGGGARSELWRQMLADMLDVPVAPVGVAEGAAYGAALLGAVASGLHPTVFSAVEHAVVLGEPSIPGADVPAYAALYPRYRALYRALRGEFAALHAVAG